MKRILYLLTIYIFCTFIVLPCSADEKLNIAGNWKLIRTHINSSGGYIEDITFYDALGYPYQIINVGASPNGKNIVLPIWYDNMRRDDAKSYLPYVSLSNSGTVEESTPFSSQESFYTSYINSSEASYAYYRKSYEPSILNRVTEQYNTGSTYSNRPQTYSYLSNTLGQVKKLDVNSDNTITISTYSAGDLYCNQATNEDGSITETFTDKSSRKVMERTFEDNKGWIKTYYGYDNLGRLSWVISPQGAALLPQSGTLLSSSVIGSKYSYIYTYDGKNNIIEKSIPSKGTEYYIYDKGDRVVMSQDQNQRESNLWMFMVYDNINRLVERSLINTSLSRAQIQQAYNNTINTYPNPAGSDRVDIPFNSSSYTPVQSLESIRYRGGEYMPVYREKEYLVPLSNSVYMQVDTTLIIPWGAYYYVPYGFYLQEDDNVQSIYYICSDPNYPEIKYYYIPDVFMDIAQSLTQVDPSGAYQFVYSYPCSGTPESSMTITSGIPLETRPDSLPAFTVPSYLGFTPVSGVVSSSDLDTINIHSSKVYERVALLEGESSLSDSKNVERAFYYDYLGRIIQTVEKNHLGGTSRTSYKYDFTGNILSLYESHQSSSSASADTKLTNYNYDSRSRLLSETTSVNSQVSVTVSYSYDNLGKLIAKTYGNGVKEDLTYNTQGWLKSKNTAKSGANIFSMTLRYYDPIYANSVSLYSGNISEIEWQHAAGTNNAYAFSYDKLGRLLNTTRYLNGTSQTSFTERGIDYDNNGNIELLKRYGSSASSPQDNFIYNYNGNTLTSITGTINASYSHDGNGNITVDGRKNLQIEYNLFNL
ncbi:MAG: DUF6443 domain-containing protein, partial [Candidatus Dojkabacteria bacterium]|nr:DUF6443 domain-containing protein [Candidatus Dojkabacteria bacterium]